MSQDNPAKQLDKVAGVVLHTEVADVYKNIEGPRPLALNSYCTQSLKPQQLGNQRVSKIRMWKRGRISALTRQGTLN